MKTFHIGSNIQRISNIYGKFITLFVYIPQSTHRYYKIKRNSESMRERERRVKEEEKSKRVKEEKSKRVGRREREAIFSSADFLMVKLEIENLNTIILTLTGITFSFLLCS